jgi:hypothetical protein
MASVKSKAAITAFFILGAASVDAQAQSVQVASQEASKQRGIAASAFQVPVAFGARWGSFGAGMFVESLDDGVFPDDDVDGALGLAFGLGDPDKYLGLETAVAFTSLFADRGGDQGFGEAGAMSFKLHTNVPGYASFAVGVTDVARWGDASGASQHSFYGVGSKYFEVGDFDMVVNLGVGDGSWSDNTGASVFGSGAFYFTPQISVIGEYTGRFINAAVSAAPFPTWPFTITLGGTNLGGRFGLDPQLALGVGVGFTL